MKVFHTPARFLNFLKRGRPFLLLLSLALLGVGGWSALVDSPPDYQMGETVRIMYVHVPASWLALGLYAAMTGAALISLIWRHMTAELSVKALAPIGATFCLISLVTGSLWGKPMWGTWWVWDARLTSMLILFLIYIGYQALVNSFDNRSIGLRSGHYFVLIGALNLPIVKWSVDWWTTLHQPASLLRFGKPAIHADFLVPLAWMGGGFILFALYLFTLRFQLEVQRRHSLNKTHPSNDDTVRKEASYAA